MSGHSPLGFSGAERYFNCPGSVALIAALPPSDEPDPEWTRAGTAAHAAAAHCLRNGLDAWECAAQDWEGYTLTAEDLAAIQFYLDTVRPLANRAMIEEEIRAPTLHELAYGTIDLLEHRGGVVTITDYKHGEGQFVAVEWNKQMLGYAALVAEHYMTARRFKLRVVQPRFEGEQKVREWEIDRATLMDWVANELKPAMNRATIGMIPGGQLKAGPWCRFCPVQKALSCPEHKQIVEVFEQVPVAKVEQMSNERLGELYAMWETAIKMTGRSIEAEALRRRLNGIDVPGTKTVKKKADRVWKDNAQQTLAAALGPCVMTTPKLKSPAEMEKLGKSAKQLTKEHAYTPDNGYTVALISDRRHAVTVQKPSEKFSKYIDKDEELS